MNANRQLEEATTQTFFENNQAKDSEAAQRSHSHMSSTYHTQLNTKNIRIPLHIAETFNLNHMYSVFTHTFEYLRYDVHTSLPE